MQNTLPFLFSLYRANAVMTRRLSGHGLDFNDLMVIYHLNQADGKRLRRIDLAHRLGLTASGATRLLLPLEKLGIIRRQDDAADSRAKLAVLTPAGEELLRDALNTLEMRLEEAIPDSERSLLPEFTDTLDRITENLLEPEYRAEAKVRWGHTDAYRQSQEKMKKMSPAQLELIKQDSDELMRAIAAAAGQSPDSPAVQELIKKHYENLRHFYEPNLELYRGLADMYVSDPRFASYFEKYRPGLANFMHAAILAFCEQNT